MFQLLNSINGNIVGYTIKEILEGKYDNLPEDAFRSVGPIEDVVAKAKAMGY